MTSWRARIGKAAGVMIVAWLACLGPAAAAPPADTTPVAAVNVQRFHLPEAALPDEAAMVLVGAALIGLAAAVRRAA